jgi:hypothetical protein
MEREGLALFGRRGVELGRALAFARRLPPRLGCQSPELRRTQHKFSHWIHFYFALSRTSHRKNNRKMK